MHLLAPGGTARNGEAAERLLRYSAQPELCGGLVEGAEQHEQQGWIEAQRRVWIWRASSSVGKRSAGFKIWRSLLLAL